MQDNVLKAVNNQNYNCKFYLKQYGNGTISLQKTPNGFHFLSICKSSRKLCLQEYSLSSKFEVFTSEGKIILKAANGKYLSRINYGGFGHTGGVDFIEAAKNEIDIFCKFEVFDNPNTAMEILEPYIDSHLPISFQADNGKYLCMY